MPSTSEGLKANGPVGPLQQKWLRLCQAEARPVRCQVCSRFTRNARKSILKERILPLRKPKQNKIRLAIEWCSPEKGGYGSLAACCHCCDLYFHQKTTCLTRTQTSLVQLHNYCMPVFQVRLHLTALKHALAVSIDEPCAHVNVNRTLICFSTPFSRIIARYARINKCSGCM